MIMDTCGPYTDIAPLYDSLLRHVDYQEWYEYIVRIMKRHVKEPKAILELGCGTGRFGAKFSNDGYTIFGMDRSMEMLRVARTRAFFNFRILCGDITRFSLVGKMDFIFSVHDTMNYLLEDADINRVCRCAREALSPPGAFMFDITTEYNIRKNFNGKTTRYQIRDCAVNWSNRYDEDKKLVYSTLDITRRGKSSTEVHVQRIYTVEEMERLVEDGGLAIVGIFGDYTLKPPRDDTIMVNFITRPPK